VALRCGSLGIGAAEEGLLFRLLRQPHALGARGFELSLQAFEAASIMRTGVHDHCPIGFPVDRHRALMEAIERAGAILRRGGLGDVPDRLPVIGLDGREDYPLVLVVSGRQTGDEPCALAKLGQIGIGDHRQVGDVDKGSRLDSVLLHVFGDLAEQTVIDRLVRGIAVLDLAEDRYVAIHAQQREHELLQIRALVLAVALRDLARRRFLLRAEIVATKVDRGRVEGTCWVDTAKLSNALTDSAEKTLCVPAAKKQSSIRPTSSSLKYSAGSSWPNNSAWSHSSNAVCKW